MTDFSAFSSPSYSVTDWIDEIIKEKSEEETLDSYLATLIMKLHVVSQEYTEQIENSMIEAMTSIPRVTSDIQRLNDILSVLQREMIEISSQLYEFDQRNISGVEDLTRLDTLKLNMKKCQSILEEHTRWNTLVREAKNMMESGGHYSDTADRWVVFRRIIILLMTVTAGLKFYKIL